MSTYQVVWDNGHPDSKECADRAEVDKLLNDLMTMCEYNKYAYFDIWVYEGDKDVTDSFLALNPERSMVKEIIRENNILNEKMEGKQDGQARIHGRCE